MAYVLDFKLILSLNLVQLLRYPEHGCHFFGSLGYIYSLVCDCTASQYHTRNCVVYLRLSWSDCNRKLSLPLHYSL